MGGYSDSDDDRKRKKKKKKRSISRSRDGSEESSVSRRSGKHKSKKKKRQRSRSRSPDIKYRKRSLSRDRGYKRSRSRSPSRRYDRRSRSRSYDRYRSRSRDRRSKRDARSRSPRRSYSRDRRSGSRSYSKKRGRHSRSSSLDSRHDDKKEKDDPCASVPGFYDMAPGEQARIRMQLALKAAAAADEKLKEQGLLLNPKVEMSAGEQKKFNKALEKIERESFAPVAFFSSKDKPTVKEEDDVGRSKLERTHDDAIFGSGKLDIKLDPSERTQVNYTGATSLAHPNLHKTAQEKMGRWIEKLTALRKRKLEGESMS